MVDEKLIYEMAMVMDRLAHTLKPGLEDYNGEFLKIATISIKRYIKNNPEYLDAIFDAFEKTIDSKEICEKIREMKKDIYALLDDMKMMC